MRIDTQTETDACCLTWIARTNTPCGGDAGHGGVTELTLRDDGSTAMEVEIGGKIFELQSGGPVTLRFRGDAEARVMIDALRNAAAALERQIWENREDQRRARFSSRSIEQLQETQHEKLAQREDLDADIEELGAEISDRLRRLRKPVA